MGSERLAQGSLEMRRGVSEGRGKLWSFLHFLRAVKQAWYSKGINKIQKPNKQVVSHMIWLILSVNKIRRKVGK